ncbi:hypothetical protein WMF04_12405 [Sorangium sp. So ce260]|uniref:hypothetical protein n=1 Tax=Sorangium sp. So ce260 TaxID=3133291 RepID=UPI003F622A71
MMQKDMIVERLERKGLVIVNPQGGLGCPDGTTEPRLQYRNDARSGSVYVCSGRIRATGEYAEQFSRLVAPTHKDTIRDYPEWNGEQLEALLRAIPSRE